MRHRAKYPESSYSYVDIIIKLVHRYLEALFLKLPFSMTPALWEEERWRSSGGRPPAQTTPPDKEALLRDAFLSFLDLSVGHLTI